MSENEIRRGALLGFVLYLIVVAFIAGQGSAGARLDNNTVIAIMFSYVPLAVGGILAEWLSGKWSAWQSARRARRHSIPLDRLRPKKRLTGRRL